MKRIKIYAILLAVAIIAGVSIFYACEKEKKEETDNAKNLKKEAEFVAKNYDETCLQVDVFRDENNNVQFVTKKTDINPEGIGLLLSNALNLKPRQKKDDEGFVFEIPNDTIYWLVSFDGSEPFKFEPVNNAKAANTVEVKCACIESSDNRFDEKHCDKGVVRSSGKWLCFEKPKSPCKKCITYEVATRNNGTVKSFIGDTYLIQSNTITINGTIYE